MTMAARHATMCEARRSYVEEQAMSKCVPACKAQQEQFRSQGRPYHVAWQKVDLKRSGFRSLERFTRHFHNARLIETFNQKWRKSLKSSPNVRTCYEMCLTRGNRKHPLFL